jgi:hypothetical protein
MEKNMIPCPLCGNLFQDGPHRYEGHRLHLYGALYCCDTCWEGNWDGWNPAREEFLLKYLKEKGLPVPKRNEKGWLPRN